MVTPMHAQCTKWLSMHFVQFSPGCGVRLPVSGKRGMLCTVASKGQLKYCMPAQSSIQEEWLMEV